MKNWKESYEVILDIFFPNRRESFDHTLVIDSLERLSL